MLINTFKNCKTPYVNSSLTIEDVFKIIKEGDNHKQLIAEIRLLGKQSSTYKLMKESQLPTFRFNFNFNGKVSNSNLNGPTGLIYIDVDDSTDINWNNNLIYATWKSVSNTGRGILVRVEGLTLDNFSDTYYAIGTELGLDVDAGAAKATQQTVLSFDENIYVNTNSITFTAIKIKKCKTLDSREREKDLYYGTAPFLKSDKLRFDNISDYFVDDNENADYIVFEDKEKICQPFMLNLIENGYRNKTMFFLLSQYALLNQERGFEFLKACAIEINKRFIERYDDTKIDSIITSILNKRDEGTLKPWFNKERKIIFNPKNKTLNKKDKMKIVNSELGKIRKSKTQNDINDLLIDWDYETHGKITQSKIAKLSGKALRTIKSNWDPFKEYVKELNNDFKDVKTTVMVVEDLNEEIVPQIEANEAVEVNELLSKDEILRYFNSLDEVDDDLFETFQRMLWDVNSFSVEKYNEMYQKLVV